MLGGQDIVSTVCSWHKSNVVSAASMRPSLLLPLASQAAVIDDGFDCRLRQLALDYAEAVVLEPWSAQRAQEALDLVAEGLHVTECAGARPERRAPAGPVAEASPDVVELFVSPKGDDAAEAAGLKEMSMGFPGPDGTGGGMKVSKGGKKKGKKGKKAKAEAKSEL